MRRLREAFPTSERRVCELMEIPRMSYRYQSRRNDSVLRDRLLALAREKPRYGYRRLRFGGLSISEFRIRVLLTPLKDGG